MLSPPAQGGKPDLLIFPKSCFSKETLEN